MINKTEYEKICMLIEKGDLSKLQEFVDLSYEKGNKKYLLEARDALISYLSYYPQSFIAYLEPKSRENPLVQAVFGIERQNKIVISDNVSGGFILNDDELLDGSKIQESYMFKKHSLYSLSSVDNKKNRSIGILLNHFSQIDKKKLRLIADIEITKKQVSICEKSTSQPHCFERTRYNAFKLLGDDAKIYVSSPRSTPLLYGESSKGRGLVLGLRK